MKKQELQAREENKPKIRDRIDRFLRRPLRDPFQDFWNLDPFLGSSVFSTLTTPSIDVSETEKEIHIKADAPGYKAEDITVETDENMMTISGKTEEEKEEKDEKYLRRERSFGEFQRSFTLPNYADMENINCEYENGTIKITIPKTEKHSKSKRIQVKSKSA
jgi:HSP20 family protein